MKDIGQFAPIQTGDIPEIVPAGTTPTKDKPTETKVVSPLSKNDTLAHTDAKHAKLEHKVTFEDGQAITDTPTTPTPTTETESGETESSETPTGTGSGTTTAPTGTTTAPKDPTPLPDALKTLDADILAMVSNALLQCKEQNYKAAFDIIDKAIAAHRKAMEASARKDKQEAPIIAAKKAAAALNQLRAKFVAEEAAVKAAAARRIAP